MNNSDKISTQSDQLPIKNNGNNNDDEDNINNEDTESMDEPTEEPYEDWITIDDISIVTEMNTSQIAIQEVEESQAQLQTHGYNLRAQQTKPREHISLAVPDSLTGVDAKVEGQYPNNTGVNTEMKGQYLTIHPNAIEH